MPLTLEIWGPAIGRAHLTLDRRSIILSFMPDGAGPQHWAAAGKRRDLSDRLFRSYVHSTFWSYLSGGKDYIPVEDPRHAITEHVCSGDKEDPHVHFKLSQDVDFTVIKSMFGYQLPDEKFITEDCRRYILATCHQYFSELVQETKIETEYRLEKDLALKVQTQQKINPEDLHNPPKLTPAIPEPFKESYGPLPKPKPRMLVLLPQGILIDSEELEQLMMQALQPPSMAQKIINWADYVVKRPNSGFMNTEGKKRAEQLVSVFDKINTKDFHSVHLLLTQFLQDSWPQGLTFNQGNNAKMLLDIFGIHTHNLKTVNLPSTLLEIALNRNLDEQTLAKEFDPPTVKTLEDMVKQARVRFPKAAEQNSGKRPFFTLPVALRQLAGEVSQPGLRPSS